MSRRRRMTDIEFETICPLLNISEDSVRMARSVLVDGKSLRVVAAAEGCSFQFVDKNTQVRFESVERYQEARRIAKADGVQIPPGWERVTVIAPTDVIEKFKEELAEHDKACLLPDA
jgi:hypothetical protein